MSSLNTNTDRDPVYKDPVYCVFSLGTNIGDRLDNIKNMLKRLSGIISVSGMSFLMETAPVGTYMAQEKYYNMIVAGRTSKSPDVLLRSCLNAEKEMGRVRITDKGPRIADIDILLYGDRVVNTRSLRLPHPEILNRYFCVLGICDIDPGIKHPVTGAEFSTIKEACRDEVTNQDVVSKGVLSEAS